MTVPTTPTSSLPAVGIPGPDSTASNAEFWSWLRRHELRVQACTSCGLTRTPAAEVCHGCYELGSEWIPLKPVGRIFSWTRVWHGASDDLAGHTPYVVVMVEIDAHPDLPRVVGNLIGDLLEPVGIGDRVVGRFEDGTLLNWLRDEGR